MKNPTVSLSGPNLRTFLASSSVKPFTEYPRVPYLSVFIRSSIDCNFSSGNCLSAQPTIPSFSATVTVHVLYTNVPFDFRRRTACVKRYIIIIVSTVLSCEMKFAVLKIRGDDGPVNSQRRRGFVARGRKNEVAPMWLRCTIAVFDLTRCTECPREHDQSDSLETAAHRFGRNHTLVRRQPSQHRNKTF